MKLEKPSITKIQGLLQRPEISLTWINANRAGKFSSREPRAPGVYVGEIWEIAKRGRGNHLARQTYRDMSASCIPPEEIFKGLDGHCLSVDGREWNVCVFSVSDTNESRWVQLALEGRNRQVLTLRLAPSQNPQQAVASLFCFLTDPLATPDVYSHVA